MDFLKKLFGKKQDATALSSKGTKKQGATPKRKKGTGITITLWSRDEASANELVTDRYFLMGVLSRDSNSDTATKNFLDALGKGGSLSHKISENSTKGGYNVEITIMPPMTKAPKKSPISKRIAECVERLENIINERQALFILPDGRETKNTFVDGNNLSHEIIRQDLSKFLTGLRGQFEAWSTGRFQGQAVQKEQLLSGFSPLLRDWDKLLNAWLVYSIGGEGIDRLKKLYDDVAAISIDAQKAPFPN
jgi:hypothetical protein